MNTRNVLAAAALAAAAAATWYWSRPPVQAPVARSTGASAALGYYLRGARLVGANDEGRITYSVMAEHVVELPGEERLELTGVTIEYRPESDISWLVSAARASAPTTGSHLELSGDVRLSNDPGDGRAATVITAATMRFVPDEFTAESSAPIELKIGDAVLKAVGLKAHLKDDSVRLESEVHGRFVP